MKYEKVQIISKDKAINEFASGDPHRISKALLAVVLHENDYDWLLQLCLKYLNYGDFAVQVTAIQSIGHIARLHGRMDKELVIPLLEKLKNISELSGRVEDALDDISMYT